MIKYYNKYDCSLFSYINDYPILRDIMDNQYEQRIKEKNNKLNTEKKQEVMNIKVAKENLVKFNELIAGKQSLNEVINAEYKDLLDTFGTDIISDIITEIISSKKVEKDIKYFLFLKSNGEIGFVNFTDDIIYRDDIYTDISENNNVEIKVDICGSRSNRLSLSKIYLINDIQEINNIYLYLNNKKIEEDIISLKKQILEQETKMKEHSEYSSKLANENMILTDSNISRFKEAEKYIKENKENSIKQALKITRYL